MILFRCFSISSLFSITDSFPPSKYIQVNHTFITVSHHQVRTFSSQKLTTKSFCIFFQLSNASLLNQNIASLALLFLVPCSAATLLSVLRNLEVTWVFIIIFLSQHSVSKSQNILEHKKTSAVKNNCFFNSLAF